MSKGLCLLQEQTLSRDCSPAPNRPPHCGCPHLVPGIDLGSMVKQLFQDVQVSSAAGPEHRRPVQLQNKSTDTLTRCVPGRASAWRMGPSLMLTKSRVSTVAPASNSLCTSWL